MTDIDLYKQIERLKLMIDEGVLDDSEIEFAENKISALKVQMEKTFRAEPAKTIIKEENKLNNEERILDQNEIELAENKIFALKTQTEKNFEAEPTKNIIKEENKLNNVAKKISNEQHFAKELEDDEIQKSETTEINMENLNFLKIRNLEFIVGSIALLSMIFIQIISVLNRYIFNIDYLFSFDYLTQPIIFILVISTIIHTVRKRQNIRSTMIGLVAILLCCCVYYFIFNDFMFGIKRSFVNATEGYSVYLMIAVAQFLFAGYLMQYSGVTQRIIDLVIALVRKMRGNLSASGILASGLFGSLYGTESGQNSGVASVLIPALERQGYKSEYSKNIIEASNGFGIFIISIPLIIMSCILDQSIVSLFLVGIYPGFLVVIGLLVVNYFKVKKYAFHDKNNPSDWDSDLTATVTMLISNGKWVLMIPIFTVGFLSSGTLTTSETATLVTVYTLLLGKLVYRQLDIKFLTMALQKTLHSFGMIATLTLVGITLSDLITITISQFSLTSLFYDKHLLSLGIADPELKMCIWSFFMVAILVLLGKTLDTITRMFIFTPIFFPIMITLGMSPITFAIIFLIGCQIDSLATHTNRCFAAAKMIVIPIIIWLPLQNWYIF